MRRFLLLLVAVMPLAVGCTGSIGAQGESGDDRGRDGPGGKDQGPGDDPFGPPGDSEPPVELDGREPIYACNQDAEPRQQPLRRLSRVQIENTVATLAAQMLGDEGAAVVQSVTSALDKLPPDRYSSIANKGRDGFLRADQDVTQLHADTHFDLAVALGRAFTASPARRAALFGDCATDDTTGNDVTCVEGFIRKWGPAILRGEVSDDDVTFYKQAMRGTTASPEALADVVVLLFASPRFLFLVESHSPVEPLPAPELAVRLSYQLWDRPPDDTLWAAVESGALMTPEGYRSEVERMLAAPEAEETLARFFEQWFTLHQTPDLTTNLGFKDYKTLVGDMQPTRAATTGMVDDVLHMVRALYRADRPLTDILTERGVYARDSFVAGLYGTDAWDGQSDPPLPGEARVGLITRPAFLASGDYSSHPILKGVRIRVQLLCDQLGEPPPDANMVAEEAPAPDGPPTARAIAEAQTAPPGCAACHRMLNPLGFATENFDSLGRERARERIIDADGALMDEVVPDTQVVPLVDEFDDEPIDGPAGLLDSIIASHKFEACFAAQYFRYTFHKIEEDREADGCLLSRLENRARKGASVRALLQTLVESPEFTHRRVD